MSYKADVIYGDRKRTMRDVIVDADTEAEARERIVQEFLNIGHAVFITAIKEES